MPPRSYETHVFSLSSAFSTSQSPESQNSNPVATNITFDSAEHASLLQKLPRQANTMPWNKGPINLDTNPSGSRNLLGMQLNLQPGLPTPQTPSNAYPQLMDVDLGINSGMDLSGDWNMDGYLNNKYILWCQITELYLYFFLSSRNSNLRVSHCELQFPTPLESPFSQYCQEYAPCYHYPALPLQGYATFSDVF